jgi:hypothetical protein
VVDAPTIQIGVRLKDVLRSAKRHVLHSSARELGDDLHARMHRDLLLEPAHPLDHRLDLRVVDNRDLPLVAQRAGERLGCKAASGHVVGGDVRDHGTPSASTISGVKPDAGPVGRLDRGADRVGIHGHHDAETCPR